jgi:phospholipase C
VRPAKTNHVDHTLTDQSSILKFIEDNWRTGQIGDHSFDQRAGSLTSMFDFRQHPSQKKLILDPKTGAVVSDH